MPKQILVLTSERDAHLPFVQKHLDEQLIVIDPVRIAKDKRLSFEVVDATIKVTFNGVALDNVVSIWYRKPLMATEADVETDDIFKEYVVSVLREHTMLLLTAFKDALWVSDFYAIRRASDKTLQLAVANELGFSVPKTLFTSDEAAAERFIKLHGACIMKPAIPFSITVDNKVKDLFATRITSAQKPNLKNLYFSPVIFQQAIDPAYDVRVNVVGDQVFASKIINEGLESESPVRDWRIGHFEGKMHISAIDDFPDELRVKCVEHVRRMGLKFGAIDMVVDKKGVYWFLENNSNGQWAFVEKATGQPISKAMADLLSNGSS